MSAAVETERRIWTEAELEAVRRSLVRDRPFGTEWWQVETAQGLGMQHTLRPRGRPKKPRPEAVPD